jgi:hypothetical protein
VIIDKQVIDRGGVAFSGGFWRRQFKGKAGEEVRAVTGLPTLFPYDKVEMVKQSLTGGEVAELDHITIKFTPQGVQRAGSTLKADWQGDKTHVVPYPIEVNLIRQPDSPDDEGILPVPLPEDNAPIALVLFHVELPRGIYPISIRTPKGQRLLINRDFWIRGGRLVFQFEPEKEFENCTIHVESASCLVWSVNSAALNLDRVWGPTDKVAYYFRQSHSLRSFRLAALQACGIKTFNYPSVIRFTRLTGRGFAYVTDEELVIADYPHTPMPEGTKVEEGDAAGDAVRIMTLMEAVTTGAIGGPNPAPLLKSLCGFSGSAASPLRTNESIPITWSTDKAGVLEIATGEDPAYLKWKQGVLDAQDDTHNLFNVFGGKVDGVYIYEFLCEVGFGDSVIVVSCSDAFKQTKNYKQLVRFATNERPVGSVPFFI